MTKEFSFKDFFFYCIYRWFYAVIFAALFAVGAIGLTFMGGSSDVLRFEATAEIVGPIEYARFFELQQGISPEPEWLVFAYNEDSRRVTDLLGNSPDETEKNIFAFLDTLDEAHAELIERVAEKNPRRFLEEKLIFRGTSRSVNVALEINDEDDEEYEADVQEFLNLYVAFVIERAYDSLTDSGPGSTFRRMRDEAGIEAIVHIRADLVDRLPPPPRGIVSAAFNGLLLGLIAALVLWIILYFADPKIKSLNEAGRLGFPVLGESPQKEFLDAEISALSVKLDGARRVCITEADGAELVNFTQKLAAFLSRAGYKVLLIDGVSLSDGKFSAYLTGAKITDCVEVVDGIDVMRLSSTKDFTSLLAKKERFAELDKAYDKVLFMCGLNQSGALTAAASLCDAAVCLFNKTLAKSKNISKAYTKTVGSDEKLRAGFAYGTPN
ncbi:MAG: AAA family ATPase [Firmicutes bacterium]|nr:AAA family ATPase [Bacillota bacterium]